MKTLIFGDIHHAPNLGDVEAAIVRERADTVVFLGDYFDQWDDTPADAERTAIWLKQSIRQPNRVHLWGNHDLPYAFPESPLFFDSPGFTENKLAAIAGVLGPQDWQRLALSHRAGDRFLITHAGVSAQHIPSDVVDPFEWLDQQERIAWGSLRTGGDHWIWGIGRGRGGSVRVGGLVWCDVDEFEPIPHVDQIFGHTPEWYGVFRRGVDSRNWCIDTGRREGVRHYVVLEHNDVTVHRIDGMLETTWGRKETRSGSRFRT